MPEGRLRPFAAVRAAGTHLSPCLLNDSDKLFAGILCVLRRETGDLILQENQARGVFKKLRAWIGLKSSLGNPGGRIASFLRLYAGLAKQLARALRLFSIEALPPSKVTCPVGGIRAAGNPPALEMLAACRQAKQVGRVRSEPKEPCFHPVGVYELRGSSVQALGICRMSSVDQLARKFEGIHPGILQQISRGGKTKGLLQNIDPLVSAGWL